MKFGTFNIRLIGSFALVFALATLNFSLIFLRDVSAFRLVTLLTFVFTLALGIALIKSILKSIREQQHIAELNKARSDFLYVASHQLRTPVSLITGTLSEFIEGGSFWDLPPEQRQKMLDATYHKAKKLTNIVNGILAASHMDSFGEFSLPVSEEIKDINLRALLKEICANSQEKADEKKLKLDYAALAATESPIVVKGSENYLEQAFTNLIDNALNYTQEGFVKVELSTTRNKAIITISDSGIGIPLEDQPRLFAKFERAKNARNAYTDGSGLGLFVVKKIVEAHPGGRISFKSEGEGKGTTFTVEITTIS